MNKESDETSNLEIDAKAALDKQVKKAKEEIEEISKTTNGKVGKIWQVRTKIMGKNKSEMEAASIINPRTNKLVVSKTEIKDVIAEAQIKKAYKLFVMDVKRSYIIWINFRIIV